MARFLMSADHPNYVNRGEKMLEQHRLNFGNFSANFISTVAVQYIADT